MNAHFPRQSDRFAARARGGFTMTELMVVIGIIAVLAGLLLVAMKGVRARALFTKTQSVMQQFRSACDSFQMEHARYPGIIPESVFADASVNPVPPISGMENALLDLMGGAYVYNQYLAPDPDFASLPLDPALTFGSTDWQLRADINAIGEGPLINGTRYAPYFTPDDATLQAVRGQVGVGGGSPPKFNGNERELPDLIDAWGQPIIYVRAARASGPLVDDGTSALPQFSRTTMMPYLESDSLGPFGRNQKYDPGSNKGGSILNGPNGSESDLMFGQIIRHPAFSSSSIATDHVNVYNGTPRGGYVLFSAGPDGIFFSAADGPGSLQEPVGGSDYDLDDFLGDGHEAVSAFDDLRVFGGA